MDTTFVNCYISRLYRRSNDYRVVSLNPSIRPLNPAIRLPFRLTDPSIIIIYFLNRKPMKES